MADENGGTAVLCSGGLDSAVLLAHELEGAAGGETVHPVYVSSGLAWEADERGLVRRLLDAPPLAGNVAPLASLDCPIGDTYSETHWALRGTAPGYATADEEVYLVGRNVLLLAKAATWCALHRVGRITVGSLAGNPFPDATPEFFDAMATALTHGLDHRIRIAAPFRTLHKEEVIARGAALGVRFELTLSCMNPAEGIHCGRCSKCRERLQAFDEAGVDDPAPYAHRPTNLLTGA